MATALQLDGGICVSERSLPPGLRQSRWAAWAWAQIFLLPRRRGQYLFTATSRGPVFARRHVVVVHDLFVFSHPEWYTRTYALTHKMTLAAQLRSAAAVVAVSEPVAAQVRTVVRGRTPVIVAPNAPAGAFLSERQPAEHACVLERFNLSEGEYLLVVAGDDPRKNLALLREAHEVASRDGLLVPLVVVGGSAKIYATESRPRPTTRQLRLTDVSDDELASLYSCSLAVLIPSLDEGFSLPAVEARACGARVIASDIPVHRWVLGDEGTFVPPADLEGWVAAIALTSRRTAEPSIRAGSIDRFSWAASARAVVRVVGELGGAGGES